MMPPDHPAGEYRPNPAPTREERLSAIEAIAGLPQLLKTTLDGLTQHHHETVYKNWTIRQIVHHLGDSHANALLRFKLALTEDAPRIFAYDPSRFVSLADSQELPLSVTLLQLEAIHARLGHLLRSLSDDHFLRGYFHPEQDRVVALNEAVGLYAWHGHHHTAQIRWLRENRLMA